MANRPFFPDDYYLAVNTRAAKKLGISLSLIELLYRPFHWVAFNSSTNGNTYLYLQDTNKKFLFPREEATYGRFYVKSKGIVGDEEKENLVREMMDYRAYFKERYEHYRKSDDGKNPLSSPEY